MLTLLIFEQFWFLTLLIFYFGGGTEDAENRNVQWQSQLTSLRKHILAAQLFPLVKVLLLRPRNWEGKGWGLAVYHDPRFHSWHGHISMAWDRAQNHILWVGDAIYHLNLCTPFSSLPSVLPSIRVFSSDRPFILGGQSIGASASVLSMNIQGWFPSGLTNLISLQSKGLSRVFSSTAIQKHQFFSAQPLDHQDCREKYQ